MKQTCDCLIDRVLNGTNLIFTCLLPAFLFPWTRYLAELAGLLESVSASAIAYLCAWMHAHTHAPCRELLDFLESICRNKLPIFVYALRMGGMALIEY